MNPQTESFINKIRCIYNHFNGQEFTSLHVMEYLKQGQATVNKYLRCGKNVGVFSVDKKFKYGMHYTYTCLPCDLEAHLEKLQFTSNFRKGNNIALDHVFGKVPIEHKCKPRKIVDNVGGKIERKRQRVYVSGSTFNII